ncbi:MAG: recombinase RecT [Clostridiales bacterium]|nr:recombinase RecT [Clostridiales bacterium]
MANELQVTFSQQLTDKLVTMENALPKEFNRERFVQNALAALNDKPELKKINAAQLQMGLLKGAMLNLDYSNKEFYLIPYGSSVQFQIDYRGMQKVAKAYSVRPIKDIHADIVRDGDQFEYEIKDNVAHVSFRPKPFSNADIVGVFCYIEYADGGVTVERMSTEDVQAVRNNYSKAKNSAAWTKSFDQMMLKTCIRRALKTVELDFENYDARKTWEEESDMNFVSKPVTGEVSNPFEMPQAPEVQMEATVIEKEVDLPDFLQAEVMDGTE